MPTTIPKNIQTYGLVTALTRSQADNFGIIQKHWRYFNAELKKYRLQQNAGNWVKYGITFKTEESYFYMTAIPQNDFVFPAHFIPFLIPEGEYEVFTHRGKMADIKNTIYDIYTNVLPNSTLKIAVQAQAGFIHFEKYDKRFNWNSTDSEIDIFLPLE
jgi:predicted transcriptional regulator YdeE